MAITVNHPVVPYTDFERIIKPAVHHFVRAMDGRFAGNEVLKSTIQVFAEITAIDDVRSIAQLLYTPPARVEQRKESYA